MRKLFTNFYSFFNTTYNLLAESTGRAQRPRDAGRLAVDYLMLISVPAVLGRLVQDLLRGEVDEWDDPEKIANNVTREQLAFLMSTVVGAREIGSAIQGYSYRGPAGLRILSEMSNLYQQAEQGEIDEAALKALNNTAGILFHYPAGQVQRTAEGVVAIAEGETENPVALLTGPPRD